MKRPPRLYLTDTEQRRQHVLRVIWHTRLDGGVQSNALMQQLGAYIRGERTVDELRAPQPVADEKAP